MICDQKNKFEQQCEKRKPNEWQFEMSGVEKYVKIEQNRKHELWNCGDWWQMAEWFVDQGNCSRNGAQGKENGKMKAVQSNRFNWLQMHDLIWFNLTWCKVCVCCVWMNYNSLLDFIYH